MVDKLILMMRNEPQKIVLIAVFCLLTGLFIKQFIALFQTDSTVEVSMSLDNQSKQESAISLRSILFRKPLFGEYTPTLFDKEIRPSTLDFEVVGIVYSGKENASQVIIRVEKGDEFTYQVGDELPGGAVIQEISKKGIVVLYNGVLESLSLPQNELLFDDPAQPLIGE